MGGKGNIIRSLPTNQYLAALKANNPSKTNPFATIEDLTVKINLLTLDEVLKKGNRAISKPISIDRNNKLGFGDESDKDDPITYFVFDDNDNLGVFVDGGNFQFLNNGFVVGDSATNDHSKIEGTFTAGRTQRLPDKDGTFAMLSDIQDGIQASESVLLNTNPAIYADGAQGSIDPAGGVSGWYYKNDGQDKINWYYVVNSSGNAMPLSSIKGMYAVILPVVAMQPYFNLYTQRQFDGQDAGTFFRSRITYNTNNVLDAYVGQPVLLYWGEDPDVYTNFPHVEMTKEEFTSVGPQAPSEEVATGTLSTSSNSTVGLYEFTVSNLGYLYGDERIDHILVAVTEAANNSSFENGIEEDTLTNTVRLGGPLTKDTIIDGQNLYSWGAVNIKEGAIISREGFQISDLDNLSLSSNRRITLSGTDNRLQDFKENADKNIKGWYYSGRSGSDFDYEDFTVNWDDVTDDAMIPTKGYVDRKTLYTIPFGRNGNVNNGAYLRCPGNVIADANRGELISQDSKIEGMTYRIENANSTGNFIFNIRLINSDGSFSQSQNLNIAAQPGEAFSIDFPPNFFPGWDGLVATSQMLAIQFRSTVSGTITQVNNPQITLKMSIQ